MALTKAKVSFVEGVDGAVLTGAMPAVDGASLTGIAGMTKETSDPLITTNPSAVGHTWLNKSTSELFSCTVATTDENVWVNIGAGFDHVHSSSFQGEIAGFTSGGNGPSRRDQILKYSFLSDTDSVDHGDLTLVRYQVCGQSSSTHGYTSGGNNLTTVQIDVIDKFAFNTNSNATDVGNLPERRRNPSGNSSSTHGYNSGGDLPPVTKNTSKFSFSTDGNANNIGNLTLERSMASTSNSTTHGYVAGGYQLDAVPFPFVTIDRFPFASDTSASDVGDLSLTRYAAAGTSSTTHGYVAGGYVSGVNANTAQIDRYSFASSASGADVGDLTAVHSFGSTGSSGVTHGYTTGGTGSSIIKFNYSSSVTSTNVASTPLVHTHAAGTQF